MHCIVFCLFPQKSTNITEIPLLLFFLFFVRLFSFLYKPHHLFLTPSICTLFLPVFMTITHSPSLILLHSLISLSKFSVPSRFLSQTPCGLPIDSAGGEFRRGGEAVRHDGGHPIDGLPANFTDEAIPCFMLLPPARVCYCRPSKSSRSQRRLLFHLHGIDYEGSKALAVDELLQVDGFERRTRCAETDWIGGLVEPSEPLHGEFLERRAMVEDGVNATHAEHRRSGCATRRELTRRLDPLELRPPPPASPPHHRRCFRVFGRST
jgi:hypothetical protein